MPSFCRAPIKNKFNKNRPLTRFYEKNWKKLRYCHNKVKPGRLYCYLHFRRLKNNTRRVKFNPMAKVIVFAKNSSVAESYMYNYQQPTKT